MTVADQGIGQAGMVLCAGMGTRMRPLSLTTPKPLINVDGKPLIGHAVDQLANNGVTNIVINTHYLADQIDTWVREQHNPNISISDETGELLETGGGVAKAKNLLGPAPFFVLNSDAFWVDLPGVSTLEKMREMFDQDKLDFLLLLAKRQTAIGFDGNGDFFLSPEGVLQRRGEAKFSPLVFAGCYLMHPRVLVDYPSGPFSMNLLWNRALENGRISGLVHDGLWLHVGTPEAIEESERAIKRFHSDLK